jgi:hypothetical protein
MKRDEFIRLSAGLAGIGPFLNSCDDKKPITGKIIGASAATGHMLRDKSFADPDIFEEKQVVIIGAGVSGLSAARHLHKNNITDITILDLEDHAGGNSSFGSNKISRFPWGAHYIPLPNNNLTDYLAFLQDANVVTGYDQSGLPVYNEYFLCQDPEERLYINGKWQDGLVPNFGLSDAELLEFKRFFLLIQGFKELKGKDGKDAFSIPVDTSSKDENIVALDTITMKTWMDQNNLTSDYIRWYVNYCTRDDFGTPYDIVSAWAGIHYFASRKGKSANASYNDVLTWEQGNGFLVQELQKGIESKIKTQALAISVKATDEGVKVTYFDVRKKQVKGYLAKHCIMAIPQFIAARLLQDKERQLLVKKKLRYVPWMVANLTINPVHERNGQPASWDNVIYGSQSLGYVDATHQQLQQRKDKRNLTYYLPLTDGEPEAARMGAYKTPHTAWTEKILKDLKLVHPDIDEATENIDVMLWGHAMAQPRPGMIHDGLRAKLAKSIENVIHFAHTDIAGVSIFEEGFYQGIKAAKKIIEPV